MSLALWRNIADLAARLELLQAADGLKQLLLTGAGDARNAEDLAAHCRKADIVKLLDALLIQNGQAADGQALLQLFVFRTVNVQRNAVADHHVRQGLLRRLRGVHAADVLSLAQHGDAIRNGEHLVQLVGDDNDRLAVGLHVPHNGKELVRLLRRQDGRRLVEDQKCPRRGRAP